MLPWLNEPFLLPRPEAPALQKNSSAAESQRSLLHYYILFATVEINDAKTQDARS